MNGLYTLVLRVQGPLSLRVGKLRRALFKRGRYLYSGSGSGKGSTSLEARVRGHLRRGKKLFWHIDYLTSSSSVKVELVAFAKSARDLECQLNSSIQANCNGEFILKGFGASDCKCISHLIRLRKDSSMQEVGNLLRCAYASVGLKVKIVSPDFFTVHAKKLTLSQIG
jgi:Uri superfamily endonuclease